MKGQMPLEHLVRLSIDHTDNEIARPQAFTDRDCRFVCFLFHNGIDNRLGRQSRTRRRDQLGQITAGTVLLERYALRS
jgi:hypothetical protein